MRVGDVWVAPAVDPDPETLTHGICPDCARRYTRRRPPGVRD